MFRNHVLLPSPSPRRRHRIRDALQGGVEITNYGTKGRLEDCEIAGNREVGLEISEDADPLVVDCQYGGE